MFIKPLLEPHASTCHGDGKSEKKVKMGIRPKVSYATDKATLLATI